MSLINRDRSIIPACDVPTLERYEELVNATKDVEGISSYKIGFELGLRFGLPKITEITREKCNCKLPLIYDHQKAATDIPDTGKKFCKTLKDSGIDIVIFFPQAGPETERAWIAAAKDEGLGIMVGGLMTHKGYAESDGGYLSDEGINQMYLVAAKEGVTDFVVPGTKPAEIARIREMLVSEGVDPSFYSPGYVAQGGSIKEAIDAAGGKLHPIVGRGIYGADDMKAAAEDLTRQL